MMDLMWVIIGALAVGSAWGIVYTFKNKKAKYTVVTWILLIISILLILFAIMWSVSSVAEGEPRAAGMGLLIFGGIGLVLLILSIRKISVDTKKNVIQKVEV